MRVLELFAGAGGMALGFHRAGWETVALAEWDPHAQSVLRARFPGVPLYGDVQEMDGRDVVASHGPVDLVSGGAPCQDLSVAGKRAGLDGSRSVLFYDLIRLWEETGATYCLYENVLGALSSQKGADFAAVLGSFVGRDVPVPRDGWTGGGGVVAGPTGVAAWRVLDAQFFGVPQRRRRVFVLGARPGGVSPEQVLLEWEGGGWHPPTSSEAGEGLARDAAGGAGGSGVRATLGTLTARMCVAIGARDVEEGAILVQDATVGALDTECGYTKATFQSVVSGHVIVPPVDGIVFANDCPPCEACGEPWCPQHAMHYADCACVGPMQEEADTFSGGDHGTFKPADVATSLRSAGGDTGGGSENIVVPAQVHSETGKGWWSEGVGPLRADPGGTPAHIVVPALTASGAGSPRTGNERTGAELVVVQEAVAFHPTQTPVNGNVAPSMGVTTGGMGVLQPEAVVDKQTGAVTEGITGTLKTDLAHDMGPVIAPTLSASNDPSRSPQSSEVTQQVAAVLSAAPIGRPRRLMPVECERLMGWPDDWTNVPDPKGKPMADSHRYKMCGNGVVSHVAQWIAESLLQAERLAL